MMFCFAKMMCAAAHEGHYGSIEKTPRKSESLRGVFIIILFYSVLQNSFR